MLKSSIHPGVVQAHLESAANAADKGQAQWFTPADWGRTLAKALNPYRPVLVDLACGNGQLLDAAGHRRTRRLGCDIQPHDDFVPADLTRFYPLLVEVGFHFDCGVFNPPWDLHWYRDRLGDLEHSGCPAVREAFAETDGRFRRDTIDSTAATLMMALDRLSRMGEGFLIANEATLQRLILGHGGRAPAPPHGALAAHVWAHLVIPGNICATTRKSGDFQTGVIWFARDHTKGLRPSTEGQAADLAAATQFTKRLAAGRLTLRTGAIAVEYLETDNTTDLWHAAATEWDRINPHAPERAPHYHLWLAGDYIQTQLSRFDQVTGRVDKTAADKLFELNGRRPIHLLARRAQRQALEAAVFGDTWRVCPQLQQAVREAIANYNAVRAPLYPLPKIQRLGFLDEHERIECLKTIPGEFHAGHSYALSSRSVHVRRSGVRMNVHGQYDDVEWDGQELAFFITNAQGRERVFMEARLRDSKVVVSVIKPGARELLRKLKITELQPCAIDFTLQELAEHFLIPDVPDVASAFPEQYQANLDTLAELERIVNA